MSIKSLWQEQRRRKAAQARQNEILERAKALGITQEKVLQEYARIAFANLSHIVHWSDSGMSFKADGELGADDVAAIAEIVESAKDHTPYRVKLYDKKAALDAIARYLGMDPLAGAAGGESEPDQNGADDPREVLIRKLDRLAARMGQAQADQKPES